MRFFDTHAHIGLIYDDPVRQISVLQQARQAGVLRIVSINSNLRDFRKEYSTLKMQRGVYHAAGVAPSEAANPGRDWERTLIECAKLPHVVAIGETGLDYYKQYADKRRQTELFIRQLELAQKLDLPVIVHNRNAGRDVFDILKGRIPPRGAVFHCYSENAEFAGQCLDAGLNVYFSFAGNLTYRNARNLHETALVIPKDRMLIETESPFMIPSEYRELKRTMPAFLPSTARFLSELLEMDMEELSEQLWKNSCRIFNLSEE